MEDSELYNVLATILGNLHGDESTLEDAKRSLAAAFSNRSESDILSILCACGVEMK